MPSGWFGCLYWLVEVKKRDWEVFGKKSEQTTLEARMRRGERKRQRQEGRWQDEALYQMAAGQRGERAHVDNAVPPAEETSRNQELSKHGHRWSGIYTA
ncbi:hypothetical protein HYQ46_011269 [Verticillium longisporum]|nr:hypothetical protein HYQ46_011269 [Verticillium longisporum]